MASELISANDSINIVPNLSLIDEDGTLHSLSVEELSTLDKGSKVQVDVSLMTSAILRKQD